MVKKGGKKMKNERRKKKRSAENTLPENALKNNENIDIRGNHDALSRRILPLARRQSKTSHPVFRGVAGLLAPGFSAAS